MTKFKVSKKVLTKEILKKLEERRKTLPELAAEIGKPAEEIRATLGGLVSDGSISMEADFYYVTDEEGITRPDLTDLEWKIVRFLMQRKGKSADVATTVLEVKSDEVTDALQRLEGLGIVVKDRHGDYKITSQSELLIPLSAEEREQLRAAEDRIDELFGEVYAGQIEVARELRRIRDGKLYRETHKRFQDYVEHRFERTRDWAYKIIRDLEVAEGLLKGSGKTENVEALLQTVSAREIPHLSRLKKDPEKMQQALQKADEKAKSENRERTAEDVKEAVQAVANGKKPEADKPKEPEVKKNWSVQFSEIGYESVASTDDLATVFVSFARWLRKHPAAKPFSIEVNEAA